MDDHLVKLVVDKVIGLLEDEEIVYWDSVTSDTTKEEILKFVDDEVKRTIEIYNATH